MKTPNTNTHPLISKAVALVTDFFNDDTTYYAASLSFFTLFANLPILTLVIFIFSYFPAFEQYLSLLTQYIFNVINPTHSQEFAATLSRYVSNAHKLGLLGLVYMLFVFVMFLKDYESIVNKIHGSKRKPLLTSLLVYLIYLIILPTLFIALNLLLTSFPIAWLKALILYAFAWFIFYSLFKVSINKKIHNRALALSSLLTLIALALSKSLFVYYVLYNTTYSSIYGSLSALLFSLFWIYISWIIYLYGIKLCDYLNLVLKRGNG